MKIKTKEREEILFKDVPFGQVFQEEDELFMKVQLNDDIICCPQCDEKIDLERELKELAVELSSGLIYQLEPIAVVKIVQGAFVEE